MTFINKISLFIVLLFLVLYCNYAHVIYSENDSNQKVYKYMEHKNGSHRENIKNEKQPNTIVLSWDNFELDSEIDLDSVSFYLDDVFTGNGIIGFEKVLLKLSDLPNGTGVVIRSPLILSTDSAPPKEYPFQYMEGMEEAFYKIIEDKKMLLLIDNFY